MNKEDIAEKVEKTEDKKKHDTEKVEGIKKQQHRGEHKKENVSSKNELQYPSHHEKWISHKDHHKPQSTIDRIQ